MWWCRVCEQEDSIDSIKDQLAKMAESIQLLAPQQDQSEQLRIMVRREAQEAVATLLAWMSEKLYNLQKAVPTAMEPLQAPQTK